MRGSSTNLTFLESLVPGQHDRRSTVRHLAQASTKLAADLQAMCGHHAIWNDRAQENQDLPLTKTFNPAMVLAATVTQRAE